MDVFTVIVINWENVFEIFRDRELSLIRSDSRVHISVLWNDSPQDTSISRVNILCELFCEPSYRKQLTLSCKIEKKTKFREITLKAIVFDEKVHKNKRTWLKLWRLLEQQHKRGHYFNNFLIQFCLTQELKRVLYIYFNFGAGFIILSWIFISHDRDPSP